MTTAHVLPTLMYGHLPLYAGVILAGGNSQRMGRHKALLRVNGQSLLAHHVSALHQLGLPALICARHHNFATDASVESKTLSQATFVADVATGAGPLAGMAGAMAHIHSLQDIDTDAARNSRQHHAIDNHDGWVVILSVDAWLTANTILELLPPLAEIAHAPDPDAIILTDHQSKDYPLLGIYRLSTLSQLERYLQQGGRRVMGFLDSLTWQRVVVPAHWQHGLNLNTPQDYQTLLANPLP